MKLEELQPQQVVQDGRLLLKVSRIRGDAVTAQVIYPLPGRATVRAYGRDQIARFTHPADGILAAYRQQTARHLTPAPRTP